MKTKLKMFHVVTFLLFLISCYWSVLGKDSTDVILVESSPDEEDGTITTEDGEEQIVDVFEPTKEWKVIKPGQAVPRGLHIRIDLSTGLKEAKLMDENEELEDENVDEKNEDSESTMRYWKDGTKEGIRHSKQKYFTHDELKNAMKLFKANQDDVKDKEAAKKIREKYRSIEEIKEDFEAMELDLETDVEVMTKLIGRYNRSGATVEEKIAALQDLEYYVHQIDNAKDLATIGGLQLIIAGLNDSDDAIRQECAFVLGSAVQSNPHVQVQAVDSGALQLLLQVLSTSQSVPLRKKAMYAISGLLRMFPYAQMKFLELGGLSTFSSLFKGVDPSVVTLKVKAVTLLHDLLVEKQDVFQYDDEGDSVHQLRKEQYKRVDLLPKMLEQNWCQLIPSLLEAPDSDVQEKVLQAMEFLMDPCHHFSQDTEVVQILLKLKRSLQSQMESQASDPDGSYVYDLTVLVDNIMNHLSP